MFQRLQATLNRYNLCPGKVSGYPTNLPTDPDVNNSLIRFFGDQSIGKALAHNFATLQTILDTVHNPGFWQRVFLQHLVEFIPRDTLFATTTTKPVAPRISRESVYARQLLEVPPDTIVLKMSSYFLA